MEFSWKHIAIEKHLKPELVLWTKLNLVNLPVETQSQMVCEKVVLKDKTIPIKKETPAKLFSWEVNEIFQNSFLTGQLPKTSFVPVWTSGDYITFFAIIISYNINICIIIRKEDCWYNGRSSRPEVFCKKVFIEISQNSKENNCAKVFFSKAEGLRPATLLKKQPWRRYFPVNSAKFLRTHFLIEHIRWLFL